MIFLALSHPDEKFLSGSLEKFSKTFTVLSDLDEEYLSGYWEKPRKSVGAFLLSTSSIFTFYVDYSVFE